MKFSFLLLLALPAFASNVICTNSPSDSALVQAAMTAGGAFTISGTCDITTSLASTTAFAITNGGSGVLTAASIGVYMAFNGDNQKMDGMTINGVAIIQGCPSGILSGGNCSGSTYTNVQTGVEFTNNTFQNYFGTSSNYSAAIQSFKIEKNFVFTGNTVQNVWYNDFANTNNSNKCSIGTVGICTNTNQTLLVHGMLFWGGYDGMTIENNLFSEISGNAGKAFTNGNSSKTGGYTGHPISISYNKFQYIHRIAWEEQGADIVGHCTGGCGNSGIVSYEKIAGNIIYHWAYPWSEDYGWSLTINVGGTAGGAMTNTFPPTQNQDIINNAIIGDSVSAAAPIGSMGPAFEDNPGFQNPGVNPPPGSRWIGNVVSSDTIGGGGYADWIYTYYNTVSPGRLYQNVVGCGPGQNTSTHNWLVSGGSTKSWYIQQYNLFQSNCINNAGSTITGSGLYTSGITSLHEADSPNFPIPGTTTFRFSEKSPNMPIKNVTYTVDAAPVSACTQEIQDVNSNFTTDLKWFYHCALVLSSYTTSSHTLVATAIDLNGTPSTASTTFTGTGSGAAVSASPSSLTFGSQTVSTTSGGQVVTLTNTGTGTVTISSIAFTTGTQYAKTTTCGGSLTMGSNCTVTVTFTPTSTGVKTDTLTFTTSATSPIVSITGTGVTSCGASLLSNSCFTLGTSGWTFQSGSGAVAFTVANNGPGGIPAANFTASGTPSGNVEIYQDGLTLVNGATYQLTGQVVTTRAQALQSYPAILDVGPYTNYDVSSPFLPNATTSFTTFSHTFIVSGSPAPGTVRMTVQFPSITGTDVVKITPLSLVMLSGVPVCAPVSFPDFIVQGSVFQGAVTAGVDDVGSNTARFQWSSDAATTSPNLNVAVYADDATWMANGSQFCASGAAPYCTGLYHTLPQQLVGVLNNTDLQGAQLHNIVPSTIYHVAGMTSADFGTTWCSSTPTTTTFTTLASSPIQQPSPPTQFTPTVPTATGTTYTVGTSPCVASGTPGSGGYISALQQCITSAAAAHTPGTVDKIILPHGVSQPVYPATPLNFPLPAGAHVVTASVATSKFTLASGTMAGAGFANGDTITVASNGFGPANPVIDGAGPVYTIINAGTSDFKVSLDGTTPLTLNTDGTSGGATQWVAKYPVAGDVTLITTDGNLPPDNVKLDPVAYSSQLAVVTLQGPVNPGPFGNGSGGIIFANGYYWLGIKWTEIPVATTNETDPPYYNSVLWTYKNMNNFTFDRNYFNGPVAPDRMLYCGGIGGIKIAVINSVFDNCSSSGPMVSALINSTKTTNTVTVGTHVYNYTLIGNTKSSCTLPSTKTLTLSGSSGQFFIYWGLPSCALSVVTQTGTTATGSGFSITSSGSPDFPRDGNGVTDVLKIGQGNWTGSVLSYSDNPFPAQTGQRVAEAAIGVQPNGGAGPFLLSNNTMSGNGIVGYFEDENSGDACGFPYSDAFPCRWPFNKSNITFTRNHIFFDNHFLVTSPNWNGSFSFGRNCLEFKNGSFNYVDGNIIGPCFGGVAGGSCLGLLQYSSPQHQVEVPGVTGQPNVTSTSDTTITNNTCIGAQGMVINGGPEYQGLYMPTIMKRVKVQNNLMITNAYTYNPPPNENANYGITFEVGRLTDQMFKHNTSMWQAGVFTMAYWMIPELTGKIDLSDNIFNYLTDSGSPGLFYNDAGSSLPPYPNPSNPPNTLLPYLNNVTFNSNVFLGSYSNSNPAFLTELSHSDIVTAATGYPANSYFPNSGTTLANRIAGMHFYDSASYTTSTLGNYRLQSTSPYISGAHLADDGLNIGADIDQLEAAQGKVNNVHTYNRTPNGFTVVLVAPDSFGCSVDWGLTNFTSGTGSYTRVANSGGTRVQTVAITGVTAHSLVYYRVNCSVEQPSGTVQLP